MEFEHIQRLVGSILSASVSQAIKIIKSTRANGSVPRSGLEKWNITGYTVKIFPVMLSASATSFLKDDL